MTTATAGPAHAALRTRACALFSVEFPIVQTGMGWVSGVRLTAATSAAGGLGILAGATLRRDELAAAIREIKARTGRPFGVNLRGDQGDLTACLDLAAGEGVRVVSFAGAPSSAAVSRLRDAGIVCISTVGARRHAEKVADLGVDAVIAQGAEGGGHTGRVPTSLVVPDVVDAVGARIPVLAAGGVMDGRGLVAALAYGADGVAMGTRFLLSAESRVPDHVKARYLAASVLDTVVTSAVDGMPQRVIRTEMIDRLERAGVLTRLPRALKAANEWRKLSGTSPVELLREGLAMRGRQGLSLSQLVMAANAPMLTKAALVDGRLEAGILPSGQNAGLIDELPSAAEIIASTIAEADAILRRLSTPA